MRQIKNRTLASENRDCIATQSLRNGTKNESPTRAPNSVFVVDFLYRVSIHEQAREVNAAIRQID